MCVLVLLIVPAAIATYNVVGAPPHPLVKPALELAQLLVLVVIGNGFVTTTMPAALPITRVNPVLHKLLVVGVPQLTLVKQVPDKALVKAIAAPGDTLAALPTSRASSLPIAPLVWLRLTVVGVQVQTRVDLALCLHLPLVIVTIGNGWIVRLISLVAAIRIARHASNNLSVVGVVPRPLAKMELV